MAFFQFIPQIIQAATSMFQGYQQAGAGADQAGWNAEQYRQRELDAIIRSSIETEQARRRGAAKVGQQQAALGASGVDVAYGTPEAVVADTMAASEYETQVAKESALREAWGLREQAAQARATEAALRKQQEMYKTILTGGTAKMHKFSLAAVSGFDPLLYSQRPKWMTR